MAITISEQTEMDNGLHSGGEVAAQAVAKGLATHIKKDAELHTEQMSLIAQQAGEIYDLSKKYAKLGADLDAMKIRCDAQQETIKVLSLRVDGFSRLLPIMEKWNAKEEQQ